jgi:hypothetical protein
MLGVKRQGPGGRQSPGFFWYARSVAHVGERHRRAMVAGSGHWGTTAFWCRPLQTRVQEPPSSQPKLTCCHPPSASRF